MKSGIFYISLKDSADASVFHLPDGHKVYIRAEVVEGSDDEALDMAQIREGESVMNTHELDQ
jgi:hypothetical protein